MRALYVSHCISGKYVTSSRTPDMDRGCVGAFDTWAPHTSAAKTHSEKIKLKESAIGAAGRPIYDSCTPPGSTTVQRGAQTPREIPMV